MVWYIMRVGQCYDEVRKIEFKNPCNKACSDTKLATSTSNEWLDVKAYAWRGEGEALLGIEITELSQGYELLLVEGDLERNVSGNARRCGAAEAANATIVEGKHESAAEWTVVPERKYIKNSSSVWVTVLAMVSSQCETFHFSV